MWAAAIENCFLEFPEGLGVFKVTMRGLEVAERDRKLVGGRVSCRLTLFFMLNFHCYTPQQKSVKSNCSFLRKRLSPTLRASDSTFVKRVYGLTYMLLLILLLCAKLVSGTFAAALPLHFPPPPVSHPNAALTNSKNTESSRTPLSKLQKKPKPAEPLVGAHLSCVLREVTIT